MFKITVKVCQCSSLISIIFVTRIGIIYSVLAVSPKYQLVRLKDLKMSTNGASNSIHEFSWNRACEGNCVALTWYCDCPSKHKLQGDKRQVENVALQLIWLLNHDKEWLWCNGRAVVLGPEGHRFDSPPMPTYGVLEQDRVPNFSPGHSIAACYYTCVYLMYVMG